MMAAPVRALSVIALVIALGAGLARGESIPATSDVLRAGNTAALAGDWQQLARLIEPLLRRELAPPDLAEAHRLAGIAAFFAQHADEAEAHFLAYLRIELDGRLDPALYPPDVVAFFGDVASRHAAELRARRTQPPHRTWLYTLVPPLGQFQNGERVKGYVLGGLLGALVLTNLTTYSYLRAWCDHTDGVSGGGLTCRDGPDGHDGTSAAKRLRPVNIASGVAFWVVYAYAVYDGVRGYWRVSREQSLQPFVTTSRDSHVLGVLGRF